MHNSGYVVTSNIASIKNIVCDEVWQITRSGKYISGALWMPELAPGPYLYRRFVFEWKNKPVKEWWHTYKDEFEKELKTKEKINALRKLRSLVESGKVIALVCFCKESKYCHRTLIGDLLKQYGIRVEELTKDKSSTNTYEQLTLF